MPGDPSAPSPSGGTGETSARRLLIGEMLVQAKVITREQLAEVLTSPREPGRKIGQMLIERGWVTEAQLTQTLSLQLSVPWVSLYHIDFSRQLLNRVSRDIAEHYCLIPIFVRHVKGQGETLYVAMDDPTNEQALVEVAKVASLPTRPMIASASDIRSAIRVYYGEPSQPMIDVPVPPVRGESLPMTTREGRARPEAAPHTPAVPTTPESHAPADMAPPRSASRPPPPLPRTASQPPPPVRPATGAEVPRSEDAPVTTRSRPPGPFADDAGAGPGGGGAGGASAAGGAAAERRPAPSDDQPQPSRRRGLRTLNLTLLDGTTIQLPAAKKKSTENEGLTARDFVSALRASAHGADTSEIVGEKIQWEPVVAALLSILLRKGLIADWEFVEELRKG